MIIFTLIKGLFEILVATFFGVKFVKTLKKIITGRD